MRVASAIALIATFLPLSAALGAEPTILKPSTPWTLDYADDSCALRRAFDNGGKTYFLELRQFSPGDSFEVTVASEEFEARQRSIKVRFLPEAAPRKFEQVLPLTYSKGLEGYRWTDSLFPVPDDAPKPDPGRIVPPRDPGLYRTREAAIEGLEVEGIASKPIVFQTGAIDRSMSGMRKCLDELMTHWAIDAAAQKTLTRAVQPIGQMGWARKIQANYPDRMLRTGKSGRARVRIIVGSDGKPTSCHVQSVVTDTVFGQTACSEMMRAARFEPALDVAGKPIASYHLTMISYTIN